MIDAAFPEPVLQAQACFRAVLDAMARPGRVFGVDAGFAPPAPLAPATASVLLTLADHETPLWLDADSAEARDWVAFHCGAPVLADPARCGFAVALGPMDLQRLPAGTHETPERSATLIQQVRALGTGRRYRLVGPGLREPALLAVDGLAEDFAVAWAANHARFPRGVDLILCAGTRLAALPRSVGVTEA